MFLRSLTEEYLQKVFYMLIYKAVKISGYVVNHGEWKHGSGEQCKELCLARKGLLLELYQL